MADDIKLPFDSRFQINIAAFLLRSRGALETFKEVIKPTYFEGSTTQTLLRIAYEYFTEYKRTPSDSTMRELIRRVYPDPSNPQHTTAISAVEQRLNKIIEADVSDADFYAAQLCAFAKWACTREVLLEAYDELKEGVFNAELPDKVRKAMAAGSSNDDLGMEWAKDTDTRVREFSSPEMYPRIPTGLMHLDMIMDGGLRMGELGIILAPPKGFKSGTMMNFGFNAMLESVGCNVAYITLELPEDLVGIRYDLRTALSTKNEIKENPSHFIQYLQNRQAALFGENRLFIKQFKTKTCTGDTIRQYLDRLYQKLDVKIGLLIVDYLDLMKSTKPKEKDYLEAVEVCEDLRSIASKEEYAIPIWTACRSTREAVGKKRINMGMISKSFERIAIADAVLANCLSRDQKVVTSRGLIKAIDLRVALRLDPTIEALSHNFATGEDEWKRIVNWWDNGRASEFVKLRFGASRSLAKTAVTTAEHRFFRADGSEVEAGSLVAGDAVIGREHKLSAFQRQVFLGTMMGDASLRPDGTLAVEHHLHQSYYVKWKQSVFADLPNSLTPIFRPSRPHGKAMFKERASEMLTVRGSIEMLQSVSKWYPENRVKVVPQEALDEIEELGLAVWFTDDGSFRKDGHRAALCTNGFSDANRRRVISWFKKRWDLTCWPDNRGVLHFDARSSQKVELILDRHLLREHCPETGETKKFLCPPPVHGTIQPMPVLVLSTERVVRRNNEKIDIEVQDNHNYYLASGVLVHNCQTEEEKLDRKMRIVPVAMRNDGSDQTVQCSVDYERMKLVSTGLAETDLEDEDEKPRRKYDGDDGKPTKKQRDRDDDREDPELNDRRKFMKSGSRKNRGDSSVVL